ncbi:unnamed protein product [Paramecium sonneborni]|uniref:Protein kinase domain-containing protein n=1 Tax=Paramecium sonneborni TaxID=65129 RepID=A0A8S1NQ79_9CILI|nr:unnamed protein product [Paramecium sonneborni]
MDSDDYRAVYKTLEMNYNKNSLIIFHKIEEKYKNEYSEPYYLLRKIKSKFFHNEQHFQSIFSLKLFNILQPHDKIIQNEDILIIIKDWSQYRLNEQILNQLNPKVIQSILLQIAITLNDLSLKNITWNLYSIKQLYLIEECIFLQAVDLDDNHFSMNITNLEIFKNFASRYFQQYKQFIEQDSFEKIIKSLLSLNQAFVINQQNHFGLLNFFKIQQVASSKGFEDVYTIEFVTPKVFEIVFKIKAKTILYKSFDQSRFNKQQLLEYQKRKIQISEKLSDCKNIVINFSYLTLFDQTFFFEVKFVMNLLSAQSKINSQQINNKQYQKLAVKILKQIISGIQAFHSLGFMHRNISPSSIYLDDENLLSANFYLGDFEKAKEQDLNQGTQQGDQYLYLPPESMEKFTIKSDIYVYGLVSLLILNRGQALFQFGFLDQTERQENFSVKTIEKKLLENGFDYNNKLISLISQCLQNDQEQRPETEELFKQIQQIYRNDRIKIIQKQEILQK